MAPTTFPQSNTSFGPPPGLDESQVATIPAYEAVTFGGNMDGSRVIVVAWQPDAEDLARLNAGSPVFLSCFGGLAPHFVSTQFPYQ